MLKVYLWVRKPRANLLLLGHASRTSSEGLGCLLFRFSGSEAFINLSIWC